MFRDRTLNAAIFTRVSADISRWSTASSLCGHKLVTELTQLSRQ